METIGYWKEFAREAGTPEPVSDRIQDRFIPVIKTSNGPSSTLLDISPL